MKVAEYQMYSLNCQMEEGLSLIESSFAALEGQALQTLEAKTRELVDRMDQSKSQGMKTLVDSLAK